MDYFGINSSKDLPQINELISENNEIGEQTE
jgi:chromosome segregation and condensation protein ScpB